MEIKATVTEEYVQFDFTRYGSTYRITVDYEDNLKCQSIESDGTTNNQVHENYQYWIKKRDGVLDKIAKVKGLYESMRYLSYKFGDDVKSFQKELGLGDSLNNDFADLMRKIYKDYLDTYNDILKIPPHVLKKYEQICLDE